MQATREQLRERGSLYLEMYYSYIGLAKEARESGDRKTSIYYWEKAKHWRTRYRKTSASLKRLEPDEYYTYRVDTRKRATIVYEPKTLPAVPPRPFPAGYYLG